MFMLIILECTQAQTRMEFGKVTFSNKAPMRGHYMYVFIMAKIPKFFIGFLFPIIISGASTSYFIEMFMLISL